MANMTSLQLIVLLFVGLVYAQSEDLKCAAYADCVEGEVQCALCDGEYRFFRSECAVNAYNCNINALSSRCRIVELKYCLEKACPVPCKGICATDGRRILYFKTECDYFNYICRTQEILKELDIKNCSAQIKLETIE